MGRNGVAIRPPTKEPLAILNQAAAVQNTWYTVLDASNVVAYICSYSMSTLAETIEMRLTIDGTTYTGSQIAVAGTLYYVYFDSTTNALIVTATRTILNGVAITARAFKMEVRKTTAAAANTLNGYANYGRYLT